MFDFLADKFSTIFSRFSQNSKADNQLIEATLSDINDALLAADVPYDLVQSFIAAIKKELAAVNLTAFKGEALSRKIITTIYNSMVTFLGGTDNNGFTPQIPSLIMVMGLQGAGKTTTLGKLAHYFKQLAQKRGKERRILLASVDYYRPAAIDQLEQVAHQAGVSFYRAHATSPLAAAREIEKYAQEQRFELTFLDTAGRLHIDNQMLLELKDIMVQLAPKHKLLVLDAMTGQESLAVARAFDQAVGFDGAILSKSDSDSRGGAAFSFRYALKKPIFFSGVGEKMSDLDQFYPERAATRMLGMGDIKTLAEKADEQIAAPDQQRMYDAWDKGQFTLVDFAQQMDMVNRLGSLTSIMKYMPGMGAMKLPEGALEQGQQEMKRFRAIINSMTPKERLQSHILNDSRKKRIAQGAGVAVAEVDKLLTRFVNMQQYAKLIKKSGGLRNVFK